MLRRPRLVLTATLTLVLLGLAPAPGARAQDAPADRGGGAGLGEAEAEARARFQAGRIAFDDERYEDALQDFRRAYELSGRAELLYNVGAASERLARDQEALDAYRAFVAAMPDHAQASEAERRIAVLSARLRATAAAPSPVESSAGEPAPPEPGPPGAGPPSVGGWLWSWVALGATAVAGASIGLSWALANDAYGELERTCGAVGCSESEIASSEVEARVAATNAMIAVTSVLGAATVLLFVVEAPGVLGGGETEGPSVAIGVGPGALRVEGTF